MEHLKSKLGVGLVVLLALLPGRAGDLTKSITFSDGSRLTAAQLHTLVEGATINTTFLTGKDLLSTVDASDYALIYDTSAGAFKRMTLSSLLLANTSLITSQTDKANPASGDYFLLYDATGVALAKVSYTNLLTGNTNLIGWQPEITALTADAALLVRHGGTNVQVAVSNLWTAFLYRAAFTNLLEHTAPTNTDRLLIWDSTARTNKWTGLSGLITNLPTAVTPAMTSTLSLMETGQLKKITLTGLNATLATNLTTFTSSDWPLSNWTVDTNAINAAHGLGVTPKFTALVMVCTSSDLNYAVGDEVSALGALTYVTAAPTVFINPFSTFANATNVGCHVQWILSNDILIPDKSSGTSGSGIDKSKWSLRLYARP